MEKRGQESFAVSPSDSNSNMDDEITFSSNDVDSESASSSLQQNPGLPTSSATKVLQPALNRNSIVRNQNSRQPVSGMVWFAISSCTIAIAVFIGPKLVEEYSYAVARGKSRAEYDVAKVALRDRPLEGLSKMYEFVANKISPSVVHIDTVSNRYDKADELYVQGNKGQGSGVIYSSDGYVITNLHVISGANDISVTLSNRRVFKAKVIGRDEQTDLAVLKINATGLTPGEWADNDSIKVGTMAWAVGSPFGLDQSVTSGIISGRHRRVKSPVIGASDNYVFKDLIQTDAAINPGNSGGPLVNSVGSIMGINTSIIGGSYQGVCFSVPAGIVQNVVSEIIKNGRVERGFLGVFPEIVKYEYAEQHGITDISGAFVSLVQPNTPAASAGIKVGDIIRRWNDKVVENELTLFSLVAEAPVDSKVDLVIERKGEEISKSVTIKSRDQYQFGSRIRIPRSEQD